MLSKNFFINSLLFLRTVMYVILAVDKIFKAFASRSALISCINRPPQIVPHIIDAMTDVTIIDV